MIKQNGRIITWGDTAVEISVNYLFHLTLIAISQWAINIAFKMSLDYNVWALALILTAVTLYIDNRIKLLK